LLDTLAKAGSAEAALQHMAEVSARTGLPIDLDAARAAMMQALGSAEPLSDEALDSVAGGQANSDMVMLSIFTLGIGCAYVSINAAVRQYHCGATLYYGPRKPR